jgi:succinate dehydrogenase hydrophobic anchor subunit
MHYVSSILALYVLGLLVIVVHHMNSSYGAWAWGLTDLWAEFKPVVDPTCQQGNNAKENG